MSASEAEANEISLRAESAIALGAGLFDSLETVIDSITLAPPRSSGGWHDIDGFPKPAPRLRLAEQGASALNSIYRLSSESSHDSISAEGSRHTRSEAMTSSLSPPPHCCRARQRPTSVKRVVFIPVEE
jgi:hypothetical protein